MCSSMLDDYPKPEAGVNKSWLITAKTNSAFWAATDFGTSLTPPSLMLMAFHLVIIYFELFAFNRFNFSYKRFAVEELST
jgi:hypothetical protein